MNKNLFKLSLAVAFSLMAAGVCFAVSFLALRNPPDSATNVPVDDYFRWDSVSGATKYVLDIDQFTQSEDNISPSACQGGICSFAFLDLSIGNIEYHERYEWNITAYNSAGNPISASPYFTFDTEQAPITCNFNGSCEAALGENSTNCSDCGGTGSCDFDGVCDPGENSSNCPSDCHGGNDGGIINLLNPLKANTLWEAIDALMNFLLLLAFVLGPILIAYAAFLLLFSGGDPRKTQTAKTIIYWVLIALAVILFAKGIPSVVKGVLGG